MIQARQAEIGNPNFTLKKISIYKLLKFAFILFTNRDINLAEYYPAAVYCIYSFKVYDK